jgi:diadenylate cyclase
VPMLIGLSMVYGLYFLSAQFEIYTVNVLLNYVLSWSLVLFFIVFQNDIRRMLTQVGTGPLYSPRDRVSQNQAVEEMVKAVTHLASRGIGALIVLQHEVGLNEYIDVGTRLDARVSRELVTSIFLPDSPIHDGALIIQNGRITAAGCFLPLTANPNVSKTLGTRHRAAIGLTEETDAVVIAVSEEDGTISLAREGKITRDIDGATLRTTLQRLLVE